MKKLTFSMLALATWMVLGSSTGLVPMEKAWAGPEAQAQTQLVNLNKASSEELQLIRGVGPVIAGRILEYRQANGDFQKVEDLVNVPGIGEAKFQQVKSQITV